MSNITAALPELAPSRISRDVFNLIYLWHAIAVCMAFARTGFRFYTFRRVNIDDAFLMLAILATTAAIVLSHFLVPLAFFQNETSLGQLKPGSDFVGKMLMAKNLEEATSVMVWSTIYAVKYKPYVLQEVGDTGEEGPGLVPHNSTAFSTALPMPA
ncbi:MAG: hypothetical protein LQ340_003003 [Diploschistes diacapsis]|nr:MAG: hypothetical protein LQ340_003003 [Diploschistes diacapsis]